MRRILNDLKIMLLANLWLVPVLAALVGAVFYLVAPPPPMSARMVTGPQGGAYAQFAERLQAELAKEGFTLELQPSRGASDSLAQLLADEPEVQLGIVQSGLERTLSAAQRERLSSLGALYHEPLWLFYRADLELATLHDLRPLRLGLGTRGSGTALLSQALLQASGIATEDYPPHWQALGGGPAVRALQAGELDGLFLVAPAENPLLQQLASDPALRLHHFRRARAYAARLPFVQPLQVSEGLLNLQVGIPRQELTTLSPVASLVVNDSFHPALTPLILQASRQVLAEGNLLDPAGQFPSPSPAPFALSDDAGYFYSKGLPLLQRYLPFRIASLADRYIILLIPLLLILLPLFKAIGPIYQWRIRARIYRWYKHLREIDRQLHSGSLPAQLDEEISRLERLETELAAVEVPLSYSNELYELHVHLRYVIERLQMLQQRRATHNNY